MFTLWQKTHGFAVYFNHGISSNPNDSTIEKFDYWMTKIEAALAAGWLETGTFEQYWLENGAQWGDALGANVVQYSSAGALQTKAVV
jgi:hypothetical protein